MYQTGVENGEVYGLLWRTAGIKVIAVYTSMQAPLTARTTNATVWWILKREMTRPAKNRKTETWRSAGMASTATARWKWVTPSAKKDRMRARLWIAKWDCVFRRYRRAQRCWSVARRAQKRLMTRLRNQSTLIHIAEAGGFQFVMVDWREVLEGMLA
jgi:hypothetical protein